MFTADDDLLPLLIKQLLFKSRLDPGCNVITQLVQGPTLRRGQSAVVLRCLGAGEGLVLAAVSATPCGVLHNVVLWR